MPLYANVQQRARIAKAQADARALASAVSIYDAHMGVLLTAFTQLTLQVTNGQNQVADGGRIERLGKTRVAPCSSSGTVT